MKAKNKEKTVLGYNTPEQYFVQAKSRIYERVVREEVSSKRESGFLWVGMAATVLILIGLFESQNKNQNEFDQHYKFIIIESVSIEDAAFDDWFEEEYILAEY